MDIGGGAVEEVRNDPSAGYRCTPDKAGTHVLVPLKMSVATIFSMFILILGNVAMTASQFTRLQTQVEYMSSRMVQLEDRIQRDSGISRELDGRLRTIEANVLNTKSGLSVLQSDFKELAKELRDARK